MQKNISKKEFEKKIKKKIKDEMNRIKKLQQKRVPSIAEKIELRNLSKKAKKIYKKEKERLEINALRALVENFHIEFKKMYQLYTIYEIY